MTVGGITANTPGNLLRLHKGFFTVNGVALGARADTDVTIAVTVVKDYPDLAGAIDKVRGTGAVVEASGTMTGTLVEFSYAILSIVLGDIGYDSTGTSNQIGGATVETVHELATVTYTGINKSDGKAVAVTMAYATIEAPALTGGANGATLQYEVTFGTLVDPATPTTFGMKIEIEK